MRVRCARRRLKRVCNCCGTQTILIVVCNIVCCSPPPGIYCKTTQALGAAGQRPQLPVGHVLDDRDSVGHLAAAPTALGGRPEAGLPKGCKHTC
eukprot:366327-Chlamydomonas_euryale.AAC.12